MAPEETRSSNFPEKLVKIIWNSTCVAMERKTNSQVESGRAPHCVHSVPGAYKTCCLYNTSMI